VKNLIRNKKINYSGLFPKFEAKAEIFNFWHYLGERLSQWATKT